MRKILHNKYEKSLIPSLPRAVFEGRIVVVITPEEAENAVDYLLSQQVIGFDTETRPSFIKGVFYQVSLLQVATGNICFLFRLNYTGMTPAIVRLLEDTTVTKVGLSWHDDLLSLKRLSDFTPGTFVDIQTYIKELGIEDLSLQKIFANIFARRISKTERLSNWERDILTDKQKVYAATDAWACVVLYEEIQRLLATGDYILEMTEENDQEHETAVSEAR